MYYFMPSQITPVSLTNGFDLRRFFQIPLLKDEFHCATLKF